MHNGLVGATSLSARGALSIRLGGMGQPGHPKRAGERGSLRGITYHWFNKGAFLAEDNLNRGYAVYVYCWGVLVVFVTSGLHPRRDGIINGVSAVGVRHSVQRCKSDRSHVVL